MRKVVTVETYKYDEHSRILEHRTERWEEKVSDVSEQPKQGDIPTYLKPKKTLLSDICCNEEEDK